MSTKPSRNDPCPCGSGKKFKNCCVDNPVVTKKKWLMGLIMLALTVAATIAVGLTADWEMAAYVGTAVLIVAGIIYSFVDPPASHNKGDPGGINFGT